ncbi:MAG TPA: heme-binding protein [Kofleriaceae bacterium]|nr:heme-binding protein [Kofleriaceae bacterium]
MHSATEPQQATLPSIFDHFPRPATIGNPAVEQRNLGFWAGLLAIAAGTGAATALGAGKRGVVTGGVAALALGALRWQLSRWFTHTPQYVVEQRLGDLEIRRYPMRIEARAGIDEHDFEKALARGFGRLACYSFGANSHHEDLAMSTPVITTMHDGAYTMGFVMPPGRDLGSLPRPDDPRIHLREVPERRIAVLKFRGPFTRANIEAHEGELLRKLVDAGLSARGSVAFAGYDSPMTLPLLRRNEVWMEVV